MVSATDKLNALLRLTKIAKIWAKRVVIPGWTKEKLVALALQRRLYKTKSAASKASNVKLADQLGINLETGVPSDKPRSTTSTPKPEPIPAKKEEKPDIAQLDLDKELSQKGGFRKMQALFKAAGLKPGTSKQTLINAYEKWKEKNGVKKEEKKEPMATPKTEIEPESTKRKPEKTAGEARKKIEALYEEYESEIKQLQAKGNELSTKLEKGTSADDIKEIKEQLAAIKSDFTKKEKEYLDKAREVLYVENPSKANAFFIGTYNPTSRQVSKVKVSPEKMDVIKRGVTAFKRMVGIPDVDDMKLDVVSIDDPTGKRDRSYYEFGSDRITMRSTSDEGVVIHEAAHWLEEKSPEVHKKIEDFFQRRTQGELYRRLNDITGKAYYGEQEIAKADKFMSPYMGKKTPIGNSEILSMGLEYMYRYPSRFAKQDPDYFDFIYDLMRGR